MLPKINSSHGSETRNIINNAIDSVNIQGKSIQDLVANGQLTPTEYAQLLSIINGNVSKGEVTKYDLDKTNFKLDGTYFSTEFLQDLAGGNINTTNVLPGSVASIELAPNAVTLPKIHNPFGILPKGIPFASGGTTRLLSIPVTLNVGDKIKITDSNISMSVYYKYEVGGGEIIPTPVQGWVKEFTATESRNHTIRARYDDDSTAQNQQELFASKFYIESDEMGIKRNEFAGRFNNQIVEYQDIPQLDMVNGVISGVDGSLQAVQLDRVAVVHLQLNKGESISLKNTTGYEMALWIEGSNTYADGWRSTGYEATADTIISFMIRKTVVEQLTIEEARQQIEYINGNEFARKSDLFNIEGFSGGNNMLYPSYPVWGHEYLYSWYEKIRTNQAVKMTWAGDSTTNGSDVVTGFKRNELGKKIMTLGGYDETLVTTINAGHGSQHTGNWLGGDKDEDKRTPNGFLDEDMLGNPDLYVFAYGFNDGSNSHFPTLSWQERIDRFEENLIEGLERIRGAQYNKSPDDMAIILCTPIAAYDSGRGNTPPVWNDKIRPIIQKACRDYNCAFVDITARQYDHEFSSSWSTNGDMVHPTATANADYMSMFEPLVFPRLLQN